MLKMLNVFIMVFAAFYIQAPIMTFAADVRSDSKSEIDVTNRNDGYIRARIKSKTSKRLKLRTVYAKSNGTKIEYRYELNGAGDWETYSLQSGNGEYTISILENTVDSRYTTLLTVNVDVEYNRENAPFLVPAQNVNYTADSSVVKKAGELSKNAGTELKIVEGIYKYVVETIKYDTAKAKKIASGEIVGYLPEIEDTLETSKGICFDYASLFAAMLRSQDIPAKLIMGFVALSQEPSYHAWNEIYIKDVGWIKIRSEVFFAGKNWERMDPTLASSNTAGKRTKFLSEDGNYAKDKEY